MLQFCFPWSIVVGTELFINKISKLFYEMAIFANSSAPRKVPFSTQKAVCPGNSYPLKCYKKNTSPLIMQGDR